MNINKTTKSLKKSEIKTDWHLIDASGIVLGRLAAFAAILLRGKNKATFTPNMDMGDNVVIVNADKVALTGRKADKTKMFWYTGWLGGIRERTMGKLREEKPARLIENAVRRMLAHRKHAAMVERQMARLHVYAGPEHKHAAQKPAVVDFGAMNRKNKKN